MCLTMSSKYSETFSVAVTQLNITGLPGTILKLLCSHKLISEKELKYSYKSWEVTFLTKIRKLLHILLLLATRLKRKMKKKI